jgi:hypothetical protein
MIMIVLTRINTIQLMALPTELSPVSARQSLVGLVSAKQPPFLVD